MSFLHVHHALETDLKSSLKLVLVVMAEMADLDSGECWPTYETIGRRSSTRRRQAMVNVNKLIELGYIAKAGKKPCQNGEVNVYRMTFGGVQSTARVQPTAPHGVQPTAPRTINKPSDINKGAKRCPEDFQPSAEQIAKLSAKHPTLNLSEELDAMKDHEFKTARKDWAACFRTWCRNAEKYQRGNANGKANKSTFESITENLRGDSSESGQSDPRVVASY